MNLQRTSKKPSAGEQILGSVRLLFIEWCLEVLRAISIKFLFWKAIIEANQYAEDNTELDMRTVPTGIKKGIILDQAVLDKRWEECLGCEFLTDSNRCTKCGCFMKVKHKFAYAKCPVGKWDSYKLIGKVHGTPATT